MALNDSGAPPVFTGDNHHFVFLVNFKPRGYCGLGWYVNELNGTPYAWWRSRLTFQKARLGGEQQACTEICNIYWYKSLLHTLNYGAACMLVSSRRPRDTCEALWLGGMWRLLSLAGYRLLGANPNLVTLLRKSWTKHCQQLPSGHRQTGRIKFVASYPRLVAFALL